MSDLSHNDSAESPGSSSYGGPASPTLVDTALEEFPPPQPGAFLSRPGIPRLLTPAPHAPVPAGPNTAANHLLALGQMSPRSVHTALATQEADNKKKLDDHEETIEFLEARLVGYIDTFSQPPKGYVENGRLTTFTIPCGGGLSNPAKWVKKLDDGRVAGYTAEDGPHDLPHVCEIYASPKYTADPAEPLPHWIHETLQGSAPAYTAFLDAVKATDDWGLEADVMRFRTLDERVLAYKAQLDRTHGELKSTIITRDQCRGRLECARLAEWVSHLAGEPLRMPTNARARGGWKY